MIISILRGKHIPESIVTEFMGYIGKKMEKDAKGINRNIKEYINLLLLLYTSCPNGKVLGGECKKWNGWENLCFLYPTQRVAEGIMFFTRPAVGQSVLFFLSAQLL